MLTVLEELIEIIHVARILVLVEYNIVNLHKKGMSSLSHCKYTISVEVVVRSSWIFFLSHAVLLSEERRHFLNKENTLYKRTQLQIIQTPCTKSK